MRTSWRSVSSSVLVAKVSSPLPCAAERRDSVAAGELTSSARGDTPRTPCPHRLFSASDPGLPWVYTWLVTAVGLRRVRCPLDLGASHCFVGRALAEQLPASCRRPQPAGHPLSVTRADGSSSRTGPAALYRPSWYLAASTRRRPSWNMTWAATRTSSSATTAARARPRLPLRLGSGLPLRRMQLHFGHRVRLNLMLDVAASPATPAKSAEARVLLCTVGLGAVPTLGRPTR